MALEKARIAYVNRSSTNIPVYDSLVRSQYHAGGVTVGGEVIGQIYPNECYTVIPEYPNLSYYKIIFRNKLGNRVEAYIESSPGYTLEDYAWVKYQEPYHYYNSNGSSLVSAETSVINGVKQYIFTVKKAVTYLTPSGTNLGKLAVGTRLATNCSTCGQTHGDYMLFNMKNTGSGWVSLCSSGYGFVDLGFSVGSLVSNRAIW